MRSFVVMAMFAASLSHAAWNGYTEDRDLELDTKGISMFEVDAGAGSLLIEGVADIQNPLILLYYTISQRGWQGFYWKFILKGGSNENQESIYAPIMA